MILALIAACEVAFWLVLVAGLAVRYAFARPSLGMAVLTLVPVVDVVLLVAVAWHLRTGGTADLGHSVAAFYLGFSLSYGHRLVGWLDVRVAHRFAHGPAPIRPTGFAHTRQCWGDVGRTAAACLSAAAISAALIAWIGDPARTRALESNYGWAIAITLLETLAAVSYTVWPRTPQGERR